MSDCRKYPIIRDPNHEFLSPCSPKPAGIRMLEKISRTLPRRFPDTFGEEVLQDEEGFGILDEETGSFIHDDLK